MTATVSTPLPRRRTRGGVSDSPRCGSVLRRPAVGSRSPPSPAWARRYGWRCPSMGKPIRVLIVDDHPVVRQGLRSFLDAQPDMTVVGEATDGRTCVDAAEELQPDVVLLDLRMPDTD